MYLRVGVTAPALRRGIGDSQPGCPLPICLAPSPRPGSHLGHTHQPRVLVSDSTGWGGAGVGWGEGACHPVCCGVDEEAGFSPRAQRCNWENRIHMCTHTPFT